MGKISKRIIDGNLRVEVAKCGVWRMTPYGRIEKFHAGKWYPANYALIPADALRAFSEECDWRARRAAKSFYLTA
jgi:hypothetical protein